VPDKSDDVEAEGVGPWLCNDVEAVVEPTGKRGGGDPAGVSSCPDFKTGLTTALNCGTGGLTTSHLPGDGVLFLWSLSSRSSNSSRVSDDSSSWTVDASSIFIPFTASSRSAKFFNEQADNDLRLKGDNEALKAATTSVETPSRPNSILRILEFFWRANAKVPTPRSPIGLFDKSKSRKAVFSCKMLAKASAPASPMLLL
jgi:hypothetical protein